MGLSISTNRGQGPPVSHLCAAWAATVMYWSESSSISGRPLCEYVMNTGAWEHNWAWTSSANAGAQRQHLDASVDLPREVKNELDRLRLVARDHQSMLDRAKFADKGGKGSSSITYKGNKGEFFDNGKGGKNGKHLGKSKGNSSNRRERSPRRYGGDRR